MKTDLDLKILTSIIIIDSSENKMELTVMKCGTFQQARHRKCDQDISRKYIFIKFLELVYFINLDMFAGGPRY